jgi:hypothetical protein
MGTISTLPTLNGFPMVNVISVADSAKNEKSTGKIFFYLTMLDFTAQDLSKSNKLTALFSMDQTLYCQRWGLNKLKNFNCSQYGPNFWNKWDLNKAFLVKV